MSDAVRDNICAFGSVCVYLAAGDKDRGSLNMCVVVGDRDRERGRERERDSVLRSVSKTGAAVV